MARKAIDVHTFWWNREGKAWCVCGADLGVPTTRRLTPEVIAAADAALAKHGAGDDWCASCGWNNDHRTAEHAS